MKLTVNIPPTINKYAGRTNRWEYQKDKREYEKFSILRNLKYKPKKPIKKCSIEMKFYFEDKRRRDLNNYEKFIFDFLVSGGYIEDDNYNVIIEQKMSGYVDKYNPRVEIEIQEIK